MRGPNPQELRLSEQEQRELEALVRKLLKRGSFTSVEDLQARVYAFNDYYNQMMAKPFKWPYQGKAFTV